MTIMYERGTMIYIYILVLLYSIEPHRGGRERERRYVYVRMYPVLVPRMCVQYYVEELLHSI